MSSLKLLLRATLAHSFGGGGPSPWRVAMMRLSGLAVAALGMGALLGRGLEQVPLVDLPHPELLAVSAAITVQISVAFALLVASGTSKAGQQEVFAKLLLIWPLSTGRRWLVFMLPSIVLGLLTTLMLAGPLGLVFGKLGVGWPWLLVAGGLGFVSAFGLVRSPLRRWPQLTILWVPGLIWLEYELTRRVNDFGLLLEVRLMVAAGAVGLLALLVALAVNGRSSLRSYLTKQANHGAVKFQLSPPWWFITKLLRRASFKLGFGVALLMSLGLALAARRYGLNDLEALSFFAALLAASVTTDIRATARRCNPAEIAALHGTARFLVAGLGGALLAGAIVVSPVVMAAWGQLSGLSAGSLTHLALQLAIGVLAGLLAGTMFVPEGRDITSQFVATLLVLAMLLALPQLQSLGQLTQSQSNLVDGLVCLGILAGIYAIELQRNPYKWRTHHVQE